MNRRELLKILRNHEHWLNKDCEGWQNMKAVLRDADLSGADLRYADLSSADLSGADLTGADLRDACLCKADMSSACLTEANLTGADLRNACLIGAVLDAAEARYVNLGSADLMNTRFINARMPCAGLTWADLRNANLRGADLTGADLTGADLQFANMTHVNIKGACLHKAGLAAAVNVPYIPMVCPEEGGFFAWKRAQGRLVRLYVPKDAKRSSATGRKCRCSKAVVLGIYLLDGRETREKWVASDFDSGFIYTVGSTVVERDFDENRWEECAPGIHFFMNKKEAVDYC